MGGGLVAYSGLRGATLLAGGMVQRGRNEADRSSVRLHITTEKMTNLGGTGLNLMLERHSRSFFSDKGNQKRGEKNPLAIKTCCARKGWGRLLFRQRRIFGEKRRVP